MKMNKKTTTFFIMALAGSFVITPLAMARGLGGREGRADSKEKIERHRKEKGKELGLSAEQEKQMKALREDFGGVNEKLREGIRGKQEELRVLLDSPSPDRAKVEALINEIMALHKQMMLKRVDDVFKVREILTPEQFQKMRAMHEKHWKAKKGKREGWRRHGPDEKR